MATMCPVQRRLVAHTRELHVQNKDSRSVILRAGQPTPYLWTPPSKRDNVKPQVFPIKGQYDREGMTQG